MEEDVAEAVLDILCFKEGKAAVAPDFLSALDTAGLLSVTTIVENQIDNPGFSRLYGIERPDSSIWRLVRGAGYNIQFKGERSASTERRDNFGRIVMFGQSMRYPTLKPIQLGNDIDFTNWTLKYNPR